MNPKYLPKNADERIDRVIEEIAEVLKPIGKAGRFGFDSCHPDGGPNNAAEMLLEIADLRHALSEVEADLIPIAAIMGQEFPGGRSKAVWTQDVLTAKELMELFNEEDMTAEDFLAENKMIPVCDGLWVREGLNYRVYKYEDRIDA